MLELILGGILAALVAALGAYAYGRRGGRQSAKVEAQAKRTEALKAKGDVGNEVAGMDDFRAHSSLKRWMRADD